MPNRCRHSTSSNRDPLICTSIACFEKDIEVLILQFLSRCRCCVASRPDRTKPPNASAHPEPTQMGTSTYHRWVLLSPCRPASDLHKHSHAGTCESKQPVSNARLALQQASVKELSPSGRTHAPSEGTPCDLLCNPSCNAPREYLSDSPPASQR